MPGWDEDLTNVKTFDELPENAKNYVLKIESLINIPVRWVGVGPDRTHLLDHGV